MRSLHLLMAACLLLLPASMLAAAEKKGPAQDIPWAKDHKQALKDAKKGKKPLAVCFIQRKCKLSMVMIKNLYRDGRITDLKDRLVWLCVDPTRKDDYKWFLARCGDNVEGTPSFFFLNHKGQYADPALAGIEPATGADPSVIVAAVRTVLGRFKKGVSPQEKAAVEKLVTDGAANAKAGATAEALALFRDAIGRGEGWQALEETMTTAREGIEAMVRDGMAKVRSAIATKAPKAETRKTLQALIKAYPDTDVADWAARLVGKLGK